MFLPLSLLLETARPPEEPDPPRPRVVGSGTARLLLFPPPIPPFSVSFLCPVPQAFSAPSRFPLKLWVSLKLTAGALPRQGPQRG